MPLIIRWPGKIKPGIVSTDPVISMDLFSTIAEVADIAAIEGGDVDGVSLMPLLKQTGSLNRDAIFWHYPHYRYSDTNQVPHSMIRDGDWKLIKRYEGKPFELLNLKSDISEKNELADQMPEKVKELDEKLTNWINQSQAKLPKENPNFGLEQKK